MQTSQTIGKLAGALSKAQGMMRPAAKDTANTFFKSKYADLASVWEACRDALSKNGLAVIQTVAESDKGIAVTTLLAHCEGEWISDVAVMHPKDNTPQSAGSTITYCRRYALAAIVGVAPDDDDGNAASGKQGPRPKVASVTGEIKQKQPDWTNDQRTEIGTIFKAIYDLGGETGEKEVQNMRNTMKYDAPPDVIDAANQLLRKWQDINDQSKGTP